MISVSRKAFDEIIISMSAVEIETGGLLGSSKCGLIDTFHFDEGRCCNTKEYNPDIDMLNGLLINWNLSQIAFMGIIHSHQNKEELSAKDIYMARKLLDYNSMKHVLMPVFVVKKRIINWYEVSDNTVNHMAFHVVEQ